MKVSKTRRQKIDNLIAVVRSLYERGASIREIAEIISKNKSKYGLSYKKSWIHKQVKGME